MPKSILLKRRGLPEENEMMLPESRKCLNPGKPGNGCFYINRQDSEDDPGFSECSSDSGRESAAMSDKVLLSPALSTERPHILHYRSNTVSSSSSSENLQIGPAQSPLSPYPGGHISLLPRILENLAVSGSNQAEIKVSLKNSSADQQPAAQDTGTDSAFIQQLPASLPLNNALQPIHSPCDHHHQQLNDATTSAAPLPFSWLSPASRKRSNSMGNSTDTAAAVGPNPAAAALTASNTSANKTKQRKTKNGRRLVTDEVTTSPVSGTLIKMADSEVSNMPKDVIIVRRGDLDKTTNVVEVTEEAKRELAKIENYIGEYTCKLCKLQYDDAFQLAGHNCSRIVHIEYQCPECGKTFHCPANLASHRRWHKPKMQSAPSTPRVQKSLSMPKQRENSAPQKSTNGTLSLENQLLTSPASIPASQMPFKKRFFFGKNNSPEVAAELLSEGPKHETSKNLTKFARDTPYKPKQENPHPENFRCQVCHGIVHGAEHFARHWHECLLAASKNWSMVFFPSKRP
ncbi:uncharacterized protein LOC129586345 [Paramacrobiotus metropolitanus]|uniref:uncharacterized protein LOC129586345 n=1 Tax=Paramacrobiotus metropolitanus TaxID=2943436 RepID=UPI002445EE22|nr:uncharacterized protein LOC129586345 [Paramacrobiotus metropolitanus]